MYNIVKAKILSRIQTIIVKKKLFCRFHVSQKVELDFAD